MDTYDFTLYKYGCIQPMTSDVLWLWNKICFAWYYYGYMLDFRWYYFSYGTMFVWHATLMVMCTSDDSIIVMY